MELSAIRALVQSELHAVDQLLKPRAAAHIDIVNLLTDHVAQAGGKRLRPIVLLLMTKAFNYEGDAPVSLAAAIELVHTASLLHDDVVDESTLRRGQKTANEIWGNAASVLVGDFLYSRAFDLAVSLGHIEVTQVIAKATHLVAQGEIMQLMHRRNFNMVLADYLQIIQFKTGQLFELAAHLGALLAAPTLHQQAKTYGLNLGIAFQLMDDILDYQGQAETIGKNIGDDLRDGNLTFPLLYILQQGQEEHIHWVKQAISTGDTAYIEPLQQAILASGAIAHAEKLALDYADKALLALNDFPQNIYTESLKAIAHFSVKRSH